MGQSRGWWGCVQNSYPRGLYFWWNSMGALQIYSYKHRSVDQNREPRNNPTLMRPIHQWQKRQEYTTGKAKRWWWGTAQRHARNALDSLLIPYRKMNSNGVNLKCKTWNQKKLLPSLGSDTNDVPLKIKPGPLPAPSGRLLISWSHDLGYLLLRNFPSLQHMIRLHLGWLRMCMVEIKELLL